MCDATSFNLVIRKSSLSKHLHYNQANWLNLELVRPVNTNGGKVSFMGRGLFRFIYTALCSKTLTGLLDLLQPGGFYISDRCLDTSHVKNLPEEGLSLWISTRLTEPEWVEVLLYYHSYWQEFRSTGLVSFSPLSSLLDVCRSWKIST